MTLIEPSSRRLSARTIPEQAPDQLDLAIIQAVTYSDIFDYPLSAAEIHRYLIGRAVSRFQVEQRLDGRELAPRYLSTRENLFTLPGREAVVETRKAREHMAARLWPRATHYGSIIASLPFVRMVAVTGELAMNNTGEHSDIDYFIVTVPGRLWLCRLLVIAVVRYAALRGDTVCPNYLLSQSALVLEDRNQYTAHEVTQMAPLFGQAIYERLRSLNGWVADYLPNAVSAPRTVDVKLRAAALKRLAESLLGGRAGARIERWEMERKIRKLSRNGQHSAEVSFSPEWCKGHVDGHGERVLGLYARRWSEVEERMQ